MCGIAGVVSIEVADFRDVISRMTASLSHRGPDAQGVVATRHCHLGHTRLSIIDPTGGAQPMWDDARRYCITFNGEIYNFRQLRAELEKRGVTFQTRSDTEVLLLAYREFGEQVVERLNGQFAFAIWDEQEQSLFAARDRMGEKPLFWAQTATGTLVIASEIRGILASDLIEPRIDLVSVDVFLSLIYVTPDRTIYENVHALPPGHAFSWRAGRMRQWAYWQPRLSTESIDPQEAIGETRRLIEQAVERQMVADTTVGAFLSGGLDSATIVALMTPHASRPVKTFAAGFGDLINELPYARAVAEQYQTDHREMQMDIDVGELLLRMADVYDEPFGDSSNIPTYLISKFAREHVKVVLSGDGGDELFGGYDWYPPLRDHEQTSESATEMMLYRALSKLPLGQFRRQAKRRCKGIRDKRRHPDVWDRHLATLSIMSPNRREQLWNRNVPESTRRMLQDRYQPADSVAGIDRAVDFDLRCYLPADIFVKVDRAAMSHGLETRSPFMDVDLVEFVSSLPSRLRFNGPALKNLLRSACADLWPPAIRQRNKQGFGAPIAAWLLRPDVQSLLDKVFQPRGPLLNLLPGAGSMRRRESREPQAVWNLLCLGLWLERRQATVNSIRWAA